MSIRSDYEAGTVTVSTGGTVVTGVGTGWLAAEFQQGDIFIADGWRCNIASVDSNTQLTLDEEGGLRGGALSGAQYRLRYMSNGSRASGQARQLIDMLGTSGNIQALGGLTGSSGTVPVFTGPGTMEVRPYASGLVPRGDWDIATVYTAGDLATFNGNVFASLLNDNVGNEPPSSQTTDANWMYVPVAPGPKGEDGDPGPAGPANSLSIGTVAGGDTADATITGTAPTQVLNLTLPKGDTGGAGWTPIFAVVADGARYVQQVIDWVGGTGTKPATGEYVGPAGFVTAIGDAVNIRGASGSGTGDVVGPDVSTDGNLAVFDGVTGKMIRDGGAPFSGSYDDLSGLPTLGTAAATDASDYATAAQGITADTAVQPGDLGTAAAADISDFATAAQGVVADTAVQPGDLGTAASLDVGTTAGTVAAGNDSRITGALQSTNVATFVQFNSATADKVLETDSVWANLAALTDAATISWSQNNGYDFGNADGSGLPIAGNRLLAGPSNPRNGKKGILWFRASGETRTLTLSSAWKIAGGVEAGPYSITTSETLGVAYVTRGSTTLCTGILREPT